MQPGAVVGGFRIERLLGSGALGAVYEATQLSLSRPVALRLIGREHFSDPEHERAFREQQNMAATFHHPRVVPIYEVGEWQGGMFVASRLVRGRTLADFASATYLPEPELEMVLDPIADALDAAHAAGIVHGAVNARNVLIDGAGVAHLTDFGLGRPGTPAVDREAFDALTGLAGSGGRRRLTGALARRVALVLAVGVLAGVAVVIAAGSGDGGAANSGIEVIGCAAEPGPNTPACTLGQAAGSSGPLVVERAGVITSWRVEGAAGELTLQVIGGDDAEPFVRGFSQPARPPDEGPHEFPAQVPVEPGDRLGVLLGPGATIGEVTGAGDQSLVRWGGALAPDPESYGFERIEAEMRLEVEIEDGARPTPPAQLTGAVAQAAKAGRVLGSRFVDLETKGTVRVDLVRIGSVFALDAFRGGRRLARIDVPDLQPGGELLSLDSFTYCGDSHGLCLRWLNEGAAVQIVHSYRFTGKSFRLIG